MTFIFAIILLLLWAVGLLAYHIGGWLIHLLLVLAIIVIVVRVIQRRRRV